MENKVNLSERKAMVFAMDFIMRCMNDETCCIDWLETGVADGDISYDEYMKFFTLANYDDLEYYISDDIFADLMSQFLRIICNSCGKNVSMQKRVGVLYCDGVISESEALKLKEKA